MIKELHFFNHIKSLYQQADLICKNMVIDTESSKYGGCDLQVENCFVKLRCARITPKKIGQFVTLWKRDFQGVSIPYDIDDQVDFFVIAVFKDEFEGQFIFPKKILYQQGFLSGAGKEGKRAMRVYPPPLGCSFQ